MPDFWDYRDELAIVLRDENGLPPTGNAMEVIIAAIEATVLTDKLHDPKQAGDQIPTVSRYAIDAERALRILRKNR